MRGASVFVLKDVRLSMTDRTESSGSGSFVKTRPVQLSQEAAVSMRMRYTDSERLFRRVGHNNERDPLSVCAEEGAENPADHN